MALAHAISNAVEKSYRRGDLFDKRVKLNGCLVALLRPDTGRQICQGAANASAAIMTAKKTIPRLELIERARAEGDQFPLLQELTRLEQELGPERFQEERAYEFATEVATVESISSDIAAGHRLQDYHLHVMAEDMAQSPVPAIPEVAGRRPGFLAWQVEGEIKHPSINC